MDEKSAPKSAGGTRISGVSRTRRRAVIALVSAVAAALCLTGGAAIGVAAGWTTTVPTPDVTVTATVPPVIPADRTVPETVIPAVLRTCSVADLIDDPRLGTFQSQVRNARTGEILFERDAETPAATASSMKVLTAAAALATLGPDWRASTTVVAGTEPGTVVLVGGGDLTLTRLPTGSEPVYTGAAHLDDLAAQTSAAWRAAGRTEPIRRIVLDSSYFGGPTWDASWPATERRAGWLSHITALQVDADRANPKVFLSPRGEDPVGRAGAAFASYFPGATVTEGTAPTGATELGRVRSATLTELIPLMLIPSDNTLAEMIGRHVAISVGAGNTLAALQSGVPKALEGYGIDTGALTIVDASGMSPNNAVAPSYLTRLYLQVEARDNGLGPIRDGLAVAGETGTLGYSNRFTGANAIARGHIFGKTGSITRAYTLGGIIEAQDGSTLVFSIYAHGAVSETARQGIDTVATGFYRCGNALANF